MLIRKHINPLLKEKSSAMRIAYITLHWPRFLSSSIGKKIYNQIRVWQKLGHIVQFFSHLHSSSNNEDLVDGKRFFYQNNTNILSCELSRISAARKLLESVQNFQPDLVYLRWSMYVHPMKKVFNYSPSVIEINTNDYEEHKLLGFFKNHYNRLTRSIFLGNASGHIFTSDELAEDPVFSKFNTPYSVITNGINLENTPFYPAPNNTPPQLVFIGTPGMAWQGVEKLVHFAQRFPDIKINIIGFESINGYSQLPSNLHLHGYKVGENYEELLSSADAAIGTLSLHLKGMHEATPLKIRDCAARGIPCILPYKDTDLFDLNCNEILNIPNTPDNISTYGVEIHDFIKRVQGKRLDRGLINNRIDIIQKEKQRLVFFESILSSS